MKRIFLLILSVPFFSNAGEGFLSKSKILSEAGIRIMPAQLSKNKILPILESETSDGLYLITDEGLSKLEKEKNGKKIKLKIRTCGEDEKTFPWIAKANLKKNERFLAVAKDIGKIRIKWIAAEKTQKKDIPKCALYKDGYKVDSFEEASVKGFSKKLFFSESNSPELIKSIAERDTHKNGKNFRVPLECKKTDLSYQKVGLLDGDKCQILLESPVNCEGQGYIEGSFSSPLGIIEISNGTETESWLIYLAHGYEGDAFLGIKWNDQKGPAKEDSEIDFYVYSGC